MVSYPKADTRFRLSAPLAEELAATYGTPLYVLDEQHFRDTIRRYRTAFEAAHSDVELVFASKANSTLAVLAIAHQEGCCIDVASEGELRAALAAGVPASHCHLHGNNKSRQELEFALAQGVDQVVIDNFGEIELIASLQRGPDTKFVLRVAPGVDPITHEKISTGQADTKFGFNIGDCSAEQALAKCLEHGLPVIGFHCHVGSQLLDPGAQRSAGELIAKLAVDAKNKHGFDTKLLNVGGGLGVRYTENDFPMPVEQYSKLVTDAILGALQGTGLTPRLAQEPGRALVAESGVTLYRVGNIKTVPSREIGVRTYVSVDGGLSDNPRPALYNAKYQVERVTPSPSPDGEGAGGGAMIVTISGKHCETDKLFDHVSMPSDLAPGDLLQVLCTGAYNSSMASNYNRFPRPATALLRPDRTHMLIQRRDTWDEMFARETLPGGLG